MSHETTDMATRDRDSILDWLRGELADDWQEYQQGNTAFRTVRAIAEGVFGLALLFRLFAHVVAYSALADVEHPFDVEYHLTLGPHVARDAPLSATLQLGMASTILACLLSLQVIRISLGGVLGLFLIANWLVLLLDPVWLTLDHYRTKVNN